jgi:hypothetical protein
LISLYIRFCAKLGLSFGKLRLLARVYGQPTRNEQQSAHGSHDAGAPRPDSSPVLASEALKNAT